MVGVEGLNIETTLCYKTYWFMFGSNIVSVKPVLQEKLIVILC